MKVPLADIVGIENDAARQKRRGCCGSARGAGSRFTRSRATSLPREEINVIGCTVEEATRRVDKFLDDAALAGTAERAHHSRPRHGRAASRLGRIPHGASAGRTHPRGGGRSRRHRDHCGRVEVLTARMKMHDPFLEVIGISADGRLSADIDSELYEGHSPTSRAIHLARTQKATMAEAGSFAEKVKQQADIVRVIGEYVRLKKTGQNFTGPLPVPSGEDAVVRRASGAADLPLLRLRRGRRRLQIRDGARQVHVSRRRCARSPKSAASRFRGRASARPKSAARTSSARALVEMHREAAAFFARQLHEGCGGQGRRGVSGGSRPRSRSHEAIRPGLGAVGRRRAAARS